MRYDLIIRNGTIADGSGAPLFEGDVAVLDGRIEAVGTVDGKATREIDATGKLVTPGFIDIHTHYDGQAIWSDRMTPSSAHGVTTVVLGNCGVGFAPCRPEDHDRLIDVMTGVEDIPEVVMAAGLPWNWESFPEYLDALDARPRDIDIATLLPHSPLRVYVMGERGAAREPANADDLVQMRKLTAEAMRAGAIGFGSSRMVVHRTGGGDFIPTYEAAEDEIRAIAAGMVDAGGGLFQMVPDAPFEGYKALLQPFFDIAREAGLPLTFTLSTGNTEMPDWREAVRLVEAANAAGGVVNAQIFPRPVGLILGLGLSANPFVLCPSYARLADLPLAERVAEMRKPEVRARLLSESPNEGHPLVQLARNWEWTFPLGSEPDYEPSLDQSIAALAKARGVPPEEEAYDRLLEDDGRAMLLATLGNFYHGSLDQLSDLMQRDDVVLGLGDGGAHYGMICDASYPTFMLSHWVRDRGSKRIAIAEAIRILAAKPAAVAGLHDRGRIAPGYKADLNILDQAAMRLHKPIIRHDLPGGGQRLDQEADGYVATIVSGEIIAENGRPTGALPGKLVRGRKAEPVAA